MNREDAPGRRHRLAEDDHLVGGGVGAGDVGQAGGKAGGTLLDPLLHQILHRADLFLLSGTGVPAHGLDPNGAVGHEIDRVGRPVLVPLDQVGHAAPSPVDLRKVAVQSRQVAAPRREIGLRDRGIREPVLAYHLGGDALEQAGVDPAAGDEGEIRVAVDVDKAGADDVSAGIDPAASLPALQLADGRDPVPGDAHVGKAPGCSGAVDQPAPGDQEVEHRYRSSSQRVAAM